MSKWDQAKAELDKAASVRQNGNEGMARVCARRSVNFAFQAFLIDEKLEVPSQNVIHLLSDPQVRQFLPENLSALLDHFLQKVDENYHFDPAIDLVAEASEILIQLQSLANKGGEK